MLNRGGEAQEVDKFPRSEAFDRELAELNWPHQIHRLCKEQRMKIGDGRTRSNRRC